MTRVRLALTFLVFLSACEGQVEKESSSEMPEVTFLTREGCPKSPAMYANLMAALAKHAWPGEPVTVDIGDLPKDDPRTGYGTPTVLVNGTDLFGVKPPKPGAPT